MKPTSITKYIQIGLELSYLRSAKEGVNIHRSNGILENIFLFIKNIDQSELEVTKNALWELENFKNKLESFEEGYTLNSDDTKELFDIMDKLLFVLNAESLTKYIFIVSEKRIDVDKLIFDIKTLFAEDVFNLLPGGVKWVYIESGRCLAFECSTASAFLALRGVEGLLRFLLSKLAPKIDTSKMNWGPLITHLKKLSIPELSVLLDNLDRIRDNYRNPTNHPEKIFNIEEAQDLFNMCVGVVNEIVGYMKENNYV